VANDLATLCYIQEQVSDPEDNIDFGYHVHDRGTRFFLTFEACLQSFGVMNRNRRMYEASNIMNCINTDDYIRDQLARKSWLGEIDHPSSIIAGQDLSVSRIGNPDPKMSSHYIRQPRLEGNLLKAPIQTDSGNENGMNMAIKIVDGGIVPAFSARVLGELQNRNGNPTVFVKRLITYDWVLYPSHREAIADIKPGVLTESAKTMEEYYGGQFVSFADLAQSVVNNSKEAQWLCESFQIPMDSVVGVTDTGNSVVIQENKNIYVQPITDKFIRQKTKDTLREFLNS